jgi:hypothetical protein
MEAILSLEMVNRLSKTGFKPYTTGSAAGEVGGGPFRAVPARQPIETSSGF